MLEGKKLVEMRSAGVNNGAAALGCVASVEPDLTFAAGHDQTDEGLFHAVPRARSRCGSVFRTRMPLTSSRIERQVSWFCNEPAPASAPGCRRGFEATTRRDPLPL